MSEDDAYDRLMSQSLRPWVQAAVAKRVALVLSGVFLALLQFRSLVPFRTAEGAWSAMGTVTVLSAVAALGALLVTSSLYALANGFEPPEDFWNRPPHYGSFWT